MTAHTDYFKSATQYFTAGNQTLKDNFEKSMAALTEMNTLSRKNMEALMASATAAAKGAETIGSRAAAYSKKSVEDHMAAIRALATAKSVQEVVELQAQYAKSAFQGAVAEMAGFNETVSASVKDSFSPINERIAAVVEKVQPAR